MDSSLNLQRLRDAVESLSIIGGDSTISPQKIESSVQTLQTAPQPLQTPRVVPQAPQQIQTRGTSRADSTYKYLFIITMLILVFIIIYYFTLTYYGHAELFKKYVKNKEIHQSDGGGMETKYSGRPPEKPLELDLDIHPAPASLSTLLTTTSTPHQAKSVKFMPVTPPSMPDSASRDDLIKFARDHAAYYDAQGVPQQEAMVYITTKLKEFMKTFESTDTDDDEGVEIVTSATPPQFIRSQSASSRPIAQKETSPPPPLLIEKFEGGYVPVSDDGADNDYSTDGKRKKISSESKEVEEYMKRRQATMKTDQELSSGGGPADVQYSTQNQQHHDPNETFL